MVAECNMKSYKNHPAFDEKPYERHVEELIVWNFITGLANEKQ